MLLLKYFRSKRIYRLTNWLKFRKFSTWMEQKKSETEKKFKLLTVSRRLVVRWVCCIVLSRLMYIVFSECTATKMLCQRTGITSFEMIYWVFIVMARAKCIGDLVWIEIKRSVPSRLNDSFCLLLLPLISCCCSCLLCSEEQTRANRCIQS